MLPTEAEEQATLIHWLDWMGLRYHHSPNETGSSMEARRRAIRMKRMGTSPGFPDLVITIPPIRSVTGDGFMLCIEMKRRKGGVLSQEQRAWIDAINGLENEGIAAYVCRGAQEAIETVSEYLAVELEQSELF